MTLKYIQSGIGKLIIDMERHKHVRRTNINGNKVEIFSIKILINDFKLKKLQMNASNTPSNTHSL